VSGVDDELVSTLDVGQREARTFSRPRLRLSAAATERLLYGCAAVSYVAIGVFVTEFALSWVVGFSWLLLWVWGLPALIGRLRR
jgi:hypothetical protein